MKLTVVDSLFFIVFNFFLGSTHAQSKIPIIDSGELILLEKHYSLSNETSLSLENRLFNLNIFLNGVSKNPDVTLTYRGLMQKTWLLGKMNMYDSCIYYSEKLHSLAQKNKDSLYIAKSLVKLGLYHKRINDLPVAFTNYNRASSTYAILQDSLQVAKNLLSMAKIQKVLGELVGSQTTAVDGLIFLEKARDKKSEAGLKHIISVALKEQGRYKEALDWNNKVLLISNSGEKSYISKNEMMVYKNTRALLFAALRKYEEGIRILEDLLADSTVTKKKLEYARVLNNLGQVKWQANLNNTESEGLLLKALAIREEINSVSGLISSNIHLSKYYTNQQPKKALFYAKAALRSSQTLKNPVAMLEALDLIISLKEQLGLSMDNEAILYSATRNTLNRIQQNIRSLYATTKYDNDQLAKKNLTLAAEKAQKERANALMWLVLSGVVGVSGFAFYRIHQQKKRTKLEAAYKAEIRVAKKIHDELGNDIFYLMTQIKNQPELLTNDHRYLVLDGLDKVYQKARDINKQYAPIPTDESYGEALLELLNSYGNETVKIITTRLENQFWNQLTEEKKIHLFYVVRELMTNMRKYSKATFVGITFGNSQNQFELNYKDNGVGFEYATNKSGNGLRYVENRIQNLKGSISFDSKPDKGVSVKIKFPI